MKKQKTFIVLEVSDWFLPSSPDPEAIALQLSSNKLWKVKLIHGHKIEEEGK